MASRLSRAKVSWSLTALPQLIRVSQLSVHGHASAGTLSLNDLVAPDAVSSCLLRRLSQVLCSARLWRSGAGDPKAALYGSSTGRKACTAPGHVWLRKSGHRGRVQISQLFSSGLPQVRPFWATPLYPPGMVSMMYCACPCRRYNTLHSGATTNSSRTGSAQYRRVLYGM